MKKLKLFLYLFLMAPLAFAACSNGSSGGNNGGNSPDQTEANLALQTLVNGTFFVASALQATNETCADLQASLNTLVGTFNCSNGGTIVYTLDSFTCEEGPPTSASFSFTALPDNCTDDDNNSFDGSITLDFAGGGGSSTLTSDMSSGGITINGLLFTFDDVTVTLDTNTETTISCSGSASIDGSDCSVASDCSACTF